MDDAFVEFVRNLYSTKDFIPLHAPQFHGNENEYVLDTINSTFVSSVGGFVDEFENSVIEYTGIKYAIATVNGTAALHLALKLSGVEKNTEVITQSLTFVATCNAISYCDAFPVLIDIERTTLGLSPKSLLEFLEEYSELRDDGYSWNKSTNRRIVACIPMHTFGFPVKLAEISQICSRFNIELIEDAAESMGSFYKEKHTGSIGKISAMSFNGNKIVTSGGGGMVLTNDKELAIKARHISTTAKTSKTLAFEHDQIGYNYRLPNLNAALGVAQMESLPFYLESKRQIAKKYQEWGESNDLFFFKEPVNTSSNYWLNVAITKNKESRDLMLQKTNNSNIMTRPAWTPMHKLSIYNYCQRTNMKNTEWLFDRAVNVPSSPILSN